MYQLLNDDDSDDEIDELHEWVDVLDDKLLNDEHEQLVRDEVEHENLLNDLCELTDVMLQLVLVETEVNDTTSYVLLTEYLEFDDNDEVDDIDIQNEVLDELEVHHVIEVLNDVLVEHELDDETDEILYGVDEHDESDEYDKRVEVLVENDEMLYEL